MTTMTTRGLAIAGELTYDALIPRIQDSLLAKGVPIPRWGEESERERLGFAASILKALVELPEVREAALPDGELQAMSREAARRMLGLGILEPYLEDQQVNEIMVRAGLVRLERLGQVLDVGPQASDGYFNELARRVAEFRGKQLGPSNPFVLVDLPDGSRFTAMIPPLSANGVAINIRKFVVRRLTLSDLVRLGSLDQEAADFLGQCIASGKVSMLISGAPGAGKTTLLNALSAHFPPEVEVCLVEKFRELQIQHPRLAWAVVREQGEQGKVSMREVVNTLYTRMRPDIVIVGEVVSDEAVEFLHAINLGVIGFSTIHGNSALDALLRLESIVLETKSTYNFLATRERIARGIDLVVHLERNFQGRRYLKEIAAVEGIVEGHYELTHLTTMRHDASRRLLERLGEAVGIEMGG
jgi:pilus assembly protein CpaF